MQLMNDVELTLNTFFSGTVDMFISYYYCFKKKWPSIWKPSGVIIKTPSYNNFVRIQQKYGVFFYLFIGLTVLFSLMQYRFLSAVIFIKNC